MIRYQRIPAFSGFLVGLLIMAFAGCKKSTSVDDNLGNLTLQFQTATSSASGAKAPANILQQAEDTLRLNGSNGILVIEDLRFIVEDFELERDDTECDDQENTDDDGCEEFEADPFFVDLPLQDGEVLNLDEFEIETGLYEELEFEVDNLDLDDEDDQDKQSLASEVRSEFPDWPDDASMVITGHFISDQGDSTAFKTFAEAEIEIEMEFDTPAEIDGAAASKMLRIHIDPSVWFLRNDDTVTDLSEYDFERTGQLLEFEMEIEEGFRSAEVDNEDDDDNDDNGDDDDDDDDD